MDIKKEILINTGKKEIYTALSTEKGIKGWWAKNCMIDPMTGKDLKILFHPQGKPFDMHFRIEEPTENKKVIWTCTHNSNPSWLTTQIIF